MILKMSLSLCLSLLFSCQGDGRLQTLFQLPEPIAESSGIALTNDQNIIWTIQDNGNPSEIYRLDRSGKLLNTIRISNAENNDWEDLSSDENGNLYIGDFGNNANKRKNLCIYRLNAADLAQNKGEVNVKTRFFYPDQHDFPPKKSQRSFDAEAFFYYQNYFYLFTKDRSVPYDGETVLYQIPAREGNFAARKIGSFRTGKHFSRSAITAADISPDGKKIVLLTSDSVWLFTDYDGVNFLSGSSQKIKLEHFSQKEGVCFDGNDKLIITDEKKKSSGGNVYAFNLADLKSEP